MKSIALKSLMLILFMALVILSACKKDEVDNADNPNQYPICLITAPQNGQEFVKGDTILIQVNASDPDGNLAEVRFYIDGIGTGAATSSPFEFKWETEDNSLGNHNISAMSIDNLGLKTIDKIDVMLTDGSPKAEFTADSLFGEPPFQVQFTDQSTNSPTTFYWDFGDGNFSADQNPIHVYINEGVYNVSLKVSNAYASDSLVKYAYIIVSESLYGSFTDVRDGQNYATIEIGTQVWFAENLNFQTANSAWYDNNPENGDIYGRLYHWDDAGIACPAGWHLPSNDEWKILEMELGMSESEANASSWRGTDEGSQLKAASGWSNDGNGTNTRGFTALPGGFQEDNGSFANIGESALFWTDTETQSTHAMRRQLEWDMEQIKNSGAQKDYPMSVRCLKD